MGTKIREIGVTVYYQALTRVFFGVKVSCLAGKIPYFVAVKVGQKA